MQVVSEMAEGGIPIPSPSVRTYCGWHHRGGFARGRGWVVRPKVKARADRWAARGGLQGGRRLPRTMQGQIGVSPCALGGDFMGFHWAGGRIAVRS